MSLLHFIYLSFLLLKVSSSGVFEIRITSFYNSDSLTQTRTCCSGISESPPCTDQCKTFFSICLMHYQNPAPLDSKCTFGADMTPVLGNSTFYLGSKKKGPFIIRLPFSFSWPHSFTLTIEAWHDKQGNRTLRDPRYMIQRVVATNIILPSSKWSTTIMRSSITKMSFDYHVICDENYYGDQCDRFCRERNDQFGHFTCTKNGTRKCIEGWRGEYCDEAICPEKCHNAYGFCNKPKQCRCRIGWQGKDCTQCKTYPNCLHGVCHYPYQCICKDGWTGFLCNIDENYCSKYKPCQNGGSCDFDPSFNYTCSCPPKFKGPNCEFPKCPHEQYCLNGGKCVEISTGFRCHCPEGYYGDKCENRVRSCEEIICDNHGTCVTGELGGWCACPKGFNGSRCENEINECISSPCQNGGTCLDLINNYSCECKNDYGGRHCELHLPCPCKNGGTCITPSQCECPEKFTGPRCEIVINKCSKLRCLNGGSCLSYPPEGREECVCPLGLTGSECQYKDYCVLKPCRNGGICRYHKRRPGFKCFCPPEFSGITCELDKRLEEQMRSISDDAFMQSFKAGRSVMSRACSPHLQTISQQLWRQLLVVLFIVFLQHIICHI